MAKGFGGRVGGRGLGIRSGGYKIGLRLPFELVFKVYNVYAAGLLRKQQAPERELREALAEGEDVRL